MRREWQPTPVFLPGELHGQRSLATVHGAAKNQTQLSDTHTHTHTHTHTQCYIYIYNCPQYLCKVLLAFHYDYDLKFPIKLNVLNLKYGNWF